MAQQVPRMRIPKASDIVVNAIRREILGDKLPVGARLPSEPELAERYGLGRVTVREGLRILERDGLVDIRRGPNGGIFVRHADIRQVSEALALLFSFRDTTLGEFAQFRLHIEPKVASLAATNATEAQRTALVELAGSDHGSESTADIHDLIAESSGNDVFEFALKAMRVSLNRHFRPDMISASDRDATKLAHIKIAERIAAGDAEGAERAMTRHLAEYFTYLVENGLDKEPIIANDSWAGSDRSGDSFS